MEIRTRHTETEYPYSLQKYLSKSALKNIVGGKKEETDNFRLF